jgi:hypothetical protein
LFVISEVREANKLLPMRLFYLKGNWTVVSFESRFDRLKRLVGLHRHPSRGSLFFVVSPRFLHPGHFILTSFVARE